uniref:VM domain-containing protein n=1 Tax=Megaselia scalaris TaxID=36166 RepID=T1GAT5_MEGSC
MIKFMVLAVLSVASVQCGIVPVASTFSAHRINHAIAHPVAAAPVAPAPVNFAVPQAVPFGGHYHGHVPVPAPVNFAAPAPVNFAAPAPVNFAANFAAPSPYYPHYHVPYNYPQYGFPPQQYAFPGAQNAPVPQGPQPMNDAAPASASPAPVNDAPQQQGPVSFSSQIFQMGPGALNGQNFNAPSPAPAQVDEQQAQAAPAQQAQADAAQQQPQQAQQQQQPQVVDHQQQAFASPFFSHF